MPRPAHTETPVFPARTAFVGAWIGAQRVPVGARYLRSRAHLVSEAVRLAIWLLSCSALWRVVRAQPPPVSTRYVPGDMCLPGLPPHLACCGVRALDCGGQAR